MAQFWCQEESCCQSAPSFPVVPDGVGMGCMPRFWAAPSPSLGQNVYGLRLSKASVCPVSVCTSTRPLLGHSLAPSRGCFSFLSVFFFS